jgi:hypothetical protein
LISGSRRSARAAEASLVFGRAIRTGVPDGIQDFPDLRHGGVQREAWGQIVPGDVDGMVAGVGIGAVPSPPVVFAFMDGVCLPQH